MTHNYFVIHRVKPGHSSAVDLPTFDEVDSFGDLHDDLDFGDDRPESLSLEANAKFFRLPEALRRAK